MNRPLASYPIVRTNDAGEAEAVLSRELAELRFKSVRQPNRFRFEMNAVRLGRTMAAFNQFSTESEVDAGVIDDAVIASLSVGPPAVVELDGELVGTDRLGIVAPGRRVVVHRAAGSGVLMLRVSMQAIRERYRELTGEELQRPIVFDRSADLKQGAGGQVRRLLAYLVGDADNGDSILNNPLLRAGLDDMLLGAILSLPRRHFKTLYR